MLQGIGMAEWLNCSVQHFNRIINHHHDQIHCDNLTFPINSDFICLRFGLLVHLSTIKQQDWSKYSHQHQMYYIYSLPKGQLPLVQFTSLLSWCHHICLTILQIKYHNYFKSHAMNTSLQKNILNQIWKMYTTCINAIRKVSTVCIHVQMIMTAIPGAFKYVLVSKRSALVWTQYSDIYSEAILWYSFSSSSTPDPFKVPPWCGGLNWTSVRTVQTLYDSHLPFLPIMPALPAASITAVLDPVSLGELISHSVRMPTLGANQGDEVQWAKVHLEVLLEPVWLWRDARTPGPVAVPVVEVKSEGEQEMKEESEGEAGHKKERTINMKRKGGR